MGCEQRSESDMMRNDTPTPRRYVVHSFNFDPSRSLWHSVRIQCLVQGKTHALLRVTREFECKSKSSLVRSLEERLPVGLAGVGQQTPVFSLPILALCTLLAGNRYKSFAVACLSKALDDLHLAKIQLDFQRFPQVGAEHVRSRSKRCELNYELSSMPEDERECKGARCARIKTFDTTNARKRDRESYGAAVK